MVSPIENKECYASFNQREVLLTLITNPYIESDFFLTGGTALSVFYLHHRVSNDLDLFTLESTNLSEIGFWIKRLWLDKCTTIKEGPKFLSLLIDKVKVDFVIDPLSNRESRDKIKFENEHYLLIDTLKNIVSNKFCTLASRTEPKDFIDFYFLKKLLHKITIEDIYKNAGLKDAIFDDPPTAAFQIEEGINFIKSNKNILPHLKKQLDENDFYSFYKNIVKWLYEQINIESQ